MTDTLNGTPTHWQKKSTYKNSSYCHKVKHTNYNGTTTVHSNRRGAARSSQTKIPTDIASPVSPQRRKFTEVTTTASSRGRRGVIVPGIRTKNPLNITRRASSNHWFGMFPFGPQTKSMDRQHAAVRQES